MTKAESLILGAEKLTRTFGYWPDFHDAEILEVQLWRGHVHPTDNIYQFPVLALKIHVWQLTKEVDPEGYLICKKHTFVTLRFNEVANLEMNGFNHQNAMMELVITTSERQPRLSFNVKIIPAFGLGASFSCYGIEVVEANPCMDDAAPLP